MAKAPVVYDVATIAAQYGKTDLERLGLFIEMPYMNGKGYTKPWQPKLFKGRNMMGKWPKRLSAKQDALFEPEFKRIFEGEAIKDRRKKPPKPPKEGDKKKKKRPFFPVAGPKKSSGKGDFYGTFRGVVERLDPVLRKPPKRPGKRVKTPRNVISAPLKQGGPGYANITIGPYPVQEKPNPYEPKHKWKVYGQILGEPMLLMHCPEPYFQKNPYKPPPKEKRGPTYVKPVVPKPTGPEETFIPTGPAKWQGGAHYGCFSPFPKHKHEWYLPSWEVFKLPKERNIFAPHPMGIKTMQYYSILLNEVDLRLNAKNYSTFEPNYIKYL